MLQRERRRRLLAFYKLTLKEKLKSKNDQGKQEQENAEPVDAMHVFYK
jgi:hypothetical protein